MENSTPNKKHLLTVLVEDYFHVGAFGDLIQQRNWSNFEARYERNTKKTLDLLDAFDTKATFFVLGWIAQQNPKLIAEIASRGHEVASRGFYHRSLAGLTSDEFRDDLRKSNGYLEDACGRKVFGYRSAEKLSFERDSWIFDVLAEEGIVYDASFLPVKTDPRNVRFSHQVTRGKNVIHEFPYSTRNLKLGLLPISGGNYFRQIPFTLMRNLVRDWTERHHEPFMMYFHVWELDTEQPRISAASFYNRIRHYRKLDKMEWIINEMLAKYNFASIRDFLELADEASVPSVRNAEIVEVKPETERSKAPVSVVIPCYNEELALPYLSNTLNNLSSKLADSGFSAHYIFVDDCSTDQTNEKLRELFGEQANFEILRHETNQGVAAAIMTGLAAAKTEIVCSMDCDCTYDPNELVQMIPLLEQDVDLVTASPYHKSGGVRNVPEWRLFLSKGASFLYRRTLRTKLDTYTSCFRVYRRSSVIDIKLGEGGFLGVAELLGRLDLSGGTIVEHPSVLEVRLFGFSKMKTMRTILGHLKLLSRLAKLRFFGKATPIARVLPIQEQNAGASNQPGLLKTKNYNE